MTKLGAFALGSVAFMLTAAVSAQQATPPAGNASAKNGKVSISITGLRSSEGVIRACMTTNEDIFPRCRKDPESHQTVVPAAETVQLRFSNVKPGRYAIAVLHDENNNGKADRALGMMPKEGFGFSRDAKVRMGPPKFSDAVFDYGGGDKQLVIKMRYLL
jgi:uncharacterized protein (DUF2141 family)